MHAPDSPAQPDPQALLAEIEQLRARLAAAEQALRDVSSGGSGEEKYRQLFANMAEGFALYELIYNDQGEPIDWRVLEVNDAYALHTGLAREIVVGRRVGELFPAAVPEYLPRFAQVVASQQAIHFETYAVSVQRHQQINCFPAGPHRFANTITDITARKKAEAALHEQELRATALINAADESIWLFGLQGEILAANTTAARRVGATVERLVGRKWPGLIAPELAEARARRIEEVASSKAPVRFEDERAGMVFDHSAYPVCDDAGEVTAVAIFSRDVTERKRAEEELRRQEEDLKRAQAVGNIGSWRLNVIRNELLWSDENYRIFGIAPGTPLTYETFLSAIHPDDRAYVDAQWQAGLRGAPYDIEHRLLVDGEVKWVREKAYLELDRDGTLLGGFGITQEITKLKEADEALRQAKTAAEAATRAKSQFLANMSHELRTPMAAVLGMLEHVLDGQLEAQQRECVEIAKTSARSLVRILNDILDLTRIEAGKFTVEEQPFSLRDCVENTFNVLLPVAHKKGLVFRCQVDDAVPAMLCGDQTRFSQVLTNLAGNALKFTQHGTVEIRVSAGETLPGGKQAITCSVSDTGIGIPAQKQDRLFRFFSQVDESHSRAYGGTGLGLAISKKIVEHLGGTIGFSSEEARGSVFFFTLPLAAAAAASIPADASIRAEWSAPAVAAPPTRARLLLVEDDEAVGQVLCLLLARAQYAVDVAATGEQAVEMWRQGDHALILMDVQMPGMNGFEATAAIRRLEEERGTRVPIIAMTAHAFHEDEERCLAAGMDGYLSKPIEFQQSLRLIAQMLESAG